jgi:tRNA-dihydrouridine synthase B
MHFPKLQNKTILAPMASVNDVAFRILCKEYGCSLVMTEMISAPALSRNNGATINMIDTVEEERPFGIQLFGQHPDTILKSALFLEKNYKPDVIDFNIGCPARQIIRQGCGSALLERPSRIKEIVKNCTENLKTPFTVKIRSGFDNKKIVAVEIAKICEESGASAITVHPRTTPQAYSGKADWEIIKQVKKSVSIPVIGNGDVFSPIQATKMLEETNCDYVMIGRAAMKSPIIFQQTNDFLRKKQYKPMDDESRRKMIKKYLFLSDKYKASFFRVKLHCQHFTAGMKQSTVMRDKISRAKDVDELKKIIGL